VANILLIDDDTDLTSFLRAELEARGHTVVCLHRAEDARDRLGRQPFELVLLDNKMPGMTGIEFLEALRDRGIAVPVVMMTGASTSDTAIQATKLGAFDYVIKPDDFQSLVRELDPLIRAALEITRPAKEVRLSPQAPPDSAAQGLVGNSKQMVELYKLIAKFADSAASVLILGETGTGKELVARAFHTNSSRKNRPFVALNCTAINENLLESELFGHEPGAFTGADKLRKGMIEHANGGTLFLDEIGDMPLPLQAKLLRVLQEQEVKRVGSNEPVKVDVRVLSATHRDLEAETREGRFRRDLFERLNGIKVPVTLPPLRERLGDLPVLFDYFLTRVAEATGQPRPTIGPGTLDKLRAHTWPGNIRELQSVAVYISGVCRGQEIRPAHLDFLTDGRQPAPADWKQASAAALRRAVERAWEAGQKDLSPLLEKMLQGELMKLALERLGGNKTQVAERLGVSRGIVIKWVQEHEPE
jgi:DNA-binding NtrC family response regulator